MSWHLRSLGDHDTHHGELRGDGTVLARCGALFTPWPTLKVVGPPPGTAGHRPSRAEGEPAGSGAGLPGAPG
ncbi:MAG: hypothetical protein ACRDRA_15170 [Pseudonocardiaceae bacterium]